MSHEFNLLNDEKPSDFFPLWSETRSMPFRRSPYPAATFEMAIGAADEVLVDELPSSPRAYALIQRLRSFIALQDLREHGGYHWFPASGLWLDDHPRAHSDESAWLGRSKANRRDFGAFWEGELAPCLVELQRRASDV